MNFGEYLTDFLIRPAKDVTIYYPGLHRSITGYEIDFRRIIDEMKSKDSTLDIQTSGITLDSIYNNPSYEGNRIKDFNRIEVKDIHDINYNHTEKDILYLPQPERWKQYFDSNISSSIKNIVNKIKSGGIILTDSRLSKEHQDYLYNIILRDTNALDIQKVTSKKHGDFVVIKT